LLVHLVAEDEVLHTVLVPEQYAYASLLQAYIFKMFQISWSSRNRSHQHKYSIHNVISLPYLKLRLMQRKHCMWMIHLSPNNTNTAIIVNPSYNTQNLVACNCESLGMLMHYEGFIFRKLFKKVRTKT
jgi:hypothetical protein